MASSSLMTRVRDLGLSIRRSTYVSFEHLLTLCGVSHVVRLALSLLFLPLEDHFRPRIPHQAAGILPNCRWLHCRLQMRGRVCFCRRWTFSGGTSTPGLLGSSQKSPGDGALSFGFGLGTWAFGSEGLEASVRCSERKGW